MFNGFATKWKIVSLECQATKVDLPISSERPMVDLLLSLLRGSIKGRITSWKSRRVVMTGPNHDRATE